jgi:SpoVK/Ycf46/Vps4 family AAA+-type ATPase
MLEVPGTKIHASFFCQGVLTENVFEEKILLNVISPNDPGVTFVDIGVLDDVKETLKKLVMLPLHRPELFNEGQLRKVLA